MMLEIIAGMIVGVVVAVIAIKLLGGW